MARRTERAALELSESDREMLTTLSRSAPAREVTRAAVPLRYAAGLSISQIQREVGVPRPTIYKCVEKALAAGVRKGLRDRYHRPRQPEILPDAKAWVVSVACQQPKALGLAAEFWTLSALAAHLQREAEAAGFPRLSHISKSSVWRILQEHDLKPHQVRYHLERCDPEFDRKMREVLMVHREVFLTPAPRDAATPTTYTVSVDRVRLLQNGAHVSAPHPRRVHRRTEIPHPPRHCGNERSARAVPLAQLRLGHRMKPTASP